MSFPSRYLLEHPLPPGISGALGLGGYQLLAEVAAVGAGRIGPHAFLLIAPDPSPGVPDPGTQISLHLRRVRDPEVAVFTQLAAQLGYLRLSGYRLVVERVGLRSRIAVVDPANGAVVAEIPDKHGGGWLGGSNTASRLLERLRALPPAGSPPDPNDPELLGQVLLALALRDEGLGGAQAAELAERALALTRENRLLDPAAALDTARRELR